MEAVSDSGLTDRLTKVAEQYATDEQRVKLEVRSTGWTLQLCGLVALGIAAVLVDFEDRGAMQAFSAIALGVAVPGLWFFSRWASGRSESVRSAVESELQGLERGERQQFFDCVEAVRVARGYKPRS